MIDQFAALAQVVDVDALTMQVQVLAQGLNLDQGPVEPPGMGQPLLQLIGMAKWIAYAVAVIGVIVAAGGAVLSRQQGTSEEGTQAAIRIGIATAAIGAAGSLVGMFMTGSV